MIVNDRVWMKSAAVSCSIYVCINHRSRNSHYGDGLHFARADLNAKNRVLHRRSACVGCIA